MVGGRLPFHEWRFDKQSIAGPAYEIFCPPPWPEAKKNHLRSKLIYVASVRGLGMIFLAPVSIFNVPPQGCSFDYPPFVALCHGLGKLKCSMCNLKGAHLITHLRGHWVTAWGKFKFSFWIGAFRIQFQISLCYHKRDHLLVHHWLQLPAFWGIRWILCHWITSHWIGCCWVWIHCRWFCCLWAVVFGSVVNWRWICCLLIRCCWISCHWILIHCRWICFCLMCC